jgi:hypothetical protein
LWFVHALPAVWQPVLSGVHVPGLPADPLHLPPQHCVELVHAWLSDVQGVEPHFPLSQTNVQQSEGTLHAEPAALQPPTEFEQTFVC